MTNTAKIRGFDFVEFYVGSAKMTAYWYAKALGFTITAYSGPETGGSDRCSYYLTKNDLKIVLTSSVRSQATDITSFLARHGEGVKRWAYNVEDVEGLYKSAIERGAFAVKRPEVLEDEKGSYQQASIRIYDDSEIVFVNFDRYKGLFRPGFGEPLQKIDIQCEDTGLEFIDHMVGNVREHEMDAWANYFNRVFDFETFVDFGPGDISTKYSALLSKVVRSKDDVIKHPINEPYHGVRKSQIQEYIEEYEGSGIQHVAIATKDIIASIKALRANGVEFLSVPDTYYEDLVKSDRSQNVREDIKKLQELGILCDIEGQGYLLQLFTKPISDRPTFFYEIIQRVDGSQGFGQGNFQSLFEAIERDQALRGNL